MDHDIMEITGRENSKVFVSSGEVFLNSSCVFFEYFDVLKAPWFSFLKVIQSSNMFDNVMDLKDIKQMDDNELFFWYVCRKHRNFLLDLNINKEALIHTNIKNEKELKNWCELIMEKEMTECEYFFDDMYFLNFKDVLINLVNKKFLVNKFICYSEYYSPYIERDLNNINHSIQYLYGDINKILKENVPNETTFILSDVEKMNNILDNNKLDYSSIILTDFFKYNYDENDILKLDKSKFENHTYKLDLFDNLTV